MFPSFSETFISNKVRMLCERGHTVIVFCSEKNQSLLDVLFPNISNLEVKLLNKATIFRNWILFPFIGLKNIDLRQTLIPQIYYAVRTYMLNKVKADIIHFEFSGIGIEYLDAMENNYSKKVVSCRGSAEKVKLCIYDDRKNQFLKLIKEVDRVHCVSYDMKDTILPYCSNPKKIFVNYPSIDTNYFSREKIKEKTNSINILSVGRITFQKGYTNALYTMSFLKSQQLSFIWTIVGSGDVLEEFIFKIHEFGLTDNIILAGTKSRAEVKMLMENADIFYLPSLYEGVANVVLEAMSMELPVVVTKSGGMEEVITHRDDGLLADIFDFKSHANLILEIVNEQHLGKKLGSAARKKVVELYSLEKQTTVFENVYKELQDEK